MLRAFPGLLLLSPLALSLAAPQGPAPAHGRHTVYWDTLDATGRLVGGRVELELEALDPALPALPAPVQTLTPDSLVAMGDRVDLVFVGDGYQAGELGTYAAQVDSMVAAFFQREPFKRYANYFAVHRVDVVSVDSGVSNDPTPGITRNTALGMRFWCNGIERLLCVNVSSAYAYANNAPGVDLVAAVANSTTYGGAGYPSQNLGTASAGNSASLEVLLHEFGHALGNLADEYDYGGPQTYTGGEPGSANISTLSAAQMGAAGTKWAAWLGSNIPGFDGLISTFEGAGYSQFGLFRPTNNSLMRNLGRPFNLPGVEQLLFEIYRLVDPIDSASDTAPAYDGTETLFVNPMQPVGHALEVQWFLNSVPIPGANGTTLDLSSLGLAGCDSTVSVRVRDPISWVRDEAQRDALMTQTLHYQVVGAPAVTSTCTTSPNSAGPGAWLEASGTTSLLAGDLVLSVFACPPNRPGIFFFGTNPVQIPFGNGVRCVGGATLRLPPRFTDLFGDAEQPFGPANHPPGSALAPGDLRYFQFWYRDPAAGGAGYNLSDALAVRFCP